MYIVYKTLRGFYQPFYDDSAPKFMPLLKAKWDEIHSKANVFRYKIDNLKKRIVEEKYLLQVTVYLRYSLSIYLTTLTKYSSEN